MTILGIPDIVVGEPIDVGIETAIGIHVDVGDEICAMSRPFHHHSNHEWLNIIRDIEVHQPTTPTSFIFYLKI